VVCVDSDVRKIELLNSGVMPIFEPGLEELVLANSHAGRLSFSGDLPESAGGADAVFLAVGTPARDCDGCPDLSNLYAAIRDLAPVLDDDTLVVLKSTVPVGTGDEIELTLQECGAARGVGVVSNPEFLRAGAAVHDFLKPGRIAIGAESRSAHDIMAKIYAPLARNGTPVIHTSRRSAELIKYGSNTLLATKIAFVNELSDLCERSGADIIDVARGMGLDERIGPMFLDPGPGFGGSCFRKDALALVRMGEQHAAAMRVAEAVVASNDARKRGIVRRVSAALGGSLRGRTIAVLGLTFKANTDDMRESAAIPLVSGLIDAGAIVRAYDPSGKKGPQRVLPPQVAYANGIYEAITDADALVMVTEWDQFRRIDLSRVRRLMADPVIIDMRNVFRAEDMRSHDFRYYRVGAASRPSQGPALLQVVTSAARRHPDRAIDASSLVAEERKRKARNGVKAASPTS